jgi:hypothetical protein
MPAPAKAQDPIKNKLKQKGLGSVAQVIEVLSSITSITKKKKKKKRERRKEIVVYTQWSFTQP